MGARVIAVDLSADRRDMALAKGAHTVIDPAANDPVEAIRDLTHGEGADKTLDATSSSEARQNAVRCVRKFGTVCFVGIGGNVTLDVGADLIRRQVTLIGHQTLSKVGQADCARFIADREIDIDAYFTHNWKLEQAEEAYRLFDQQKSGKGVFLP